MEQSQVKLTQSVQKGGCAAKVSALDLREILKGLDLPPKSPHLMIDLATFDDAAVMRVSEDLCHIQTVDFFTPIVDSPELFGQIAAANALSDVYAMGGNPQYALAIFAFPIAHQPKSLATQILQGACHALKEAGASLIGGHTIDDDTLKFGLSVTGDCHPQKIWSNANARPGDVLILTKPIGTGALTAALKRQEVSEEQIQDAIQSMCQLNKVTDLLSDNQRTAVRAATDITGFGLAGHALNMSRASNVTMKIITDQIPRFPALMGFLERGFLTKAHRTNREYISERVKEPNDKLEQLMIVDPQTSGGLLLSVDPELADELLKQLKKRFSFAAIIGEVAQRVDSQTDIEFR